MGIVEYYIPPKKKSSLAASFQERYNTPLEHTQSAIPLANYEKNPFMACW